MNISEKTTIGEIVSSNFKTAQIFEDYGIDFCCGGERSLQSACAEANIDPQTILPQLLSTLEIFDADAKYFANLTPGALIDYIIERHHSYVNNHLPFLQQKLEKLCLVHGNHHPELFEIRDLFQGAAENLSKHMKKEELVLFPLIKKLSIADAESLSILKEKTLREYLGEMNEEHTTEGRRFERISYLSGNYTVPDDGCATFEVTYKTLSEFEKDLHKHIHLENNILFPKALKFEKALSAK